NRADRRNPCPPIKTVTHRDRRATGRRGSEDHVRVWHGFFTYAYDLFGIGIGGDYPVSATIMSEYSGKQSRGRMVGLVFAMQGLGLIVGPLIASIFLASGVSNNLTWRLLLGLGAIPGLAVFYLRRQIHETPRFAMAGGAADEAQAAIAAATGASVAGAPATVSTAQH